MDNDVENNDLAIDNTAIKHVKNIVEKEKDLNSMPNPMEEPPTTKYNMTDVVDDQPDFRISNNTTLSTLTTPTATSSPETEVLTPNKRSMRFCMLVDKYILSKTELYGYMATQIAQARYIPTQIVELVLTQVMLKVAIKMWGKRAMAAAKAEMKQ